jgi:hypothetical protein
MRKVYSYAVWVMTILLFGFSNAVAAPSISAVSGTITDGNSLTITGSSFGTSSLSFEWLGAAIEAGATGSTFSRTNWLNGYAYSKSVYATDQAHSGSKSLKAGPYSESSGYGGDLRYNGQAVGPDTDLFMSWWVRRTHSGSGQWKMLRLSDTNDIVDHAYEQVWFNWDNGYGSQLFTRSSSTDCTQGGGTCDYGVTYYQVDSTWIRYDLKMHTSTAGGTNGSYTVTMYRPGSAAVTHSASGIQNWNAAGHQYDWYLFQNWTGNGVTSQTDWMDDIFIQGGTQARVEIGDNSTWSACTHKEIQPPTTWSASSITVNFNRGSFASGGTAYLYVVDTNGNVNTQGYPIAIGSSGGTGTLTLPGAPTLSIQ